MKQENVFTGDMGAVIGKQFVISGAHYNDKCFPGLNDLITQACTHPLAYNRMKKKYQDIAIKSIRRYLKGYRAEKLVYPIYKFYEPTKGQKRDYDNIQSAARKIINDAMVDCKVIKDDKPKYLLFGKNEFYYTSSEPKIEVCIVEVEDAKKEVTNI